MEILRNRWLQRAVALFEYLYLVLVAWLGYKSFFYDTSIGSDVKYWILYVGGSVIFLALIFWTRERVLTAILSILLMFCMVFVLYLNIGNWWVVIPPMFVSLTAFFCSGASEGVKTVFGTILLIGYILGALAFFAVTNIFITKTVDEITLTGTSQSGVYRYAVMNIQNQQNGSTRVYVEPNDMDFEVFGIMFKPTGYKSVKYNHFPMDVNSKDFVVTFKDTTGDGIEDEMYINGERYDINELKWSFDPKEILL